jgi:demethylmenaquinone methyltransferase/2-methoxy-6-polyprenyl-1,4-benzoquinol methylase
VSFPWPLVRRIYDRRAPYYDALVQTLALGRDTRYRRAALEALRAAPPDRVLDVGCGTGRNFPLLSHAGISRLSGTDLSARSLARARARGAAVAQSDAERLPFRDAAFDRVLCTYVLTSVADWRRGLDELVRVLRPGGRLVLTDDRLPPGWFLGPGPMLRLLRQSGWVDLHRELEAAMRERLRNVELRFLHLRMIYLLSGDKAA